MRGQDICFALNLLSKCYDTNLLAIFPYLSFTIYFILINGLINTINRGFRTEDNSIAGPEPKLLPMTNTLSFAK